MDTSFTYSVYSEAVVDRNRDTLLNGVTTTSNWSGLANGIEGATVTGTPTAELLMKSYNTKNGTTIDYTTEPTIEISYLYTPRTVDNCYGYWLASPDESDAGNVWEVRWNGNIDSAPYFTSSNGARPVVCLSSDINVIQEGKLWTVVK